MGLIRYIFEMIMRTTLLLILSTFSLLIGGCGGSVSTSTVSAANKALTPAIIERKATFAGQDYSLVTLAGFQRSGLQLYWPMGSEIPATIKSRLQFILPQVNARFSKKNFAFCQLTSQGFASTYKKIFFSVKNAEKGFVNNEALTLFIADKDSLVVSYELGRDLNEKELSRQLTQVIYQSERLKYQGVDSILDKLVTRGLMLHFIEDNLPESEFIIPVDIEPSRLSAALMQLKSGLNQDELSSWFNDKPLKKQVMANAIGYYLVAQHFSFYIGSNASNSFSIASELFIPWLQGPDSSIKKTSQSVRTMDAANQIAVRELSRQANLFVGHYFVEGLNHEKLIALSFDDGPSQYTTKILDTLEEAQVPASFFWQGQHLANYQEVVKRTLNSGHTVANHSWDHANGISYNAEDLWQKQVIKTNQAFRQLFAITPRFYRPPYGEITDEQVRFLASKNMKVILWSVDSRDWNPALNSVNYIESEIINHQHEEMITLMHDAGGNRQNTLDSLPAIIKHYKSQGYRFVNLETLLGISDKH